MMIGAKLVNIVPVLIWMLPFVQHDDEESWRGAQDGALKVQQPYVILRRSRKIHVKSGKWMMIGAKLVNCVTVLIWMLHFVQHDDGRRM